MFQLEKAIGGEATHLLLQPQPSCPSPSTRETASIPPPSSSHVRSWSDAAALPFPHCNGALEPGQQLSPPYIFIFLGKWVCVSVSVSVCSEPKEGKVLPRSSHLLPSSLTLRVRPVRARDRWLLSLHQRSSPETPAFPRQSGNRTQRLALAHLHV